jgi:hypothetical protein
MQDRVDQDTNARRRPVTGRWRWRTRLGVLAVAANLVVIGLMAGPSQAQQPPSLCSGSAQGLTISGDLAVPAGEACELIDITVTGNVVVRASAVLLLEDTTVQGDLTLREDAFASTLGTQVGGAVVLRKALGVVLEGSDIAGGADSRNSGFVFSDGSTFGGRVFSANGETVIYSGWVDGDIRTNSDILTDVHDTVVTGAVNVSAAASGSLVCESEIDGDAVFRDSGELVQLGAGALSDCAFNVFAGRLVLRGNDALIGVGGNVVRGNLVCEDNPAQPSGSDNRIRGQATGQCADLSPAAASLLRGAQPADAETRVADVKEQIDKRIAEAKAAIATTGESEL